ncbi:uroporphyrinogen-III C-methyltransferase [Paraburkholderia sejongensis]
MPAAMTRAWLIGAGPGDVELMTLKATRALGEADVVLVDDLVNPDVLQFARADARVVYVGKRGGHPSTPQAEIVAQMLAHLRAGRSVARLKGGDPFVFGRGGEELEALEAEGIRVDVINGITAGIAAPATLGIAVTHREHAQGVVFVTGHGAGSGKPDWAALVATRMTLVIYMGMRRLAEITAALLAAGMHADTPCAAIEAATRPEQRHALAPLGEFADTVARKGLGSPAIVVIGGVASLALARDAAQSNSETRHARLDDAGDADDTAVAEARPIPLPGSATSAAGRTDSAQRAGLTKTLSVGIGCRSHSTAADIEAAVRAALGTHPFARIAGVATIGSKADEAGLLEFCARHALPLQLFTREQIAAIPVTSPSAAAHAHLGVDGVCEPCALLAASHAVASANAANTANVANTANAANPATPASHALLLVPKTVHAGITVAIARASNAPHADAAPQSSATRPAPPNQDPR